MSRRRTTFWHSNGNLSEGLGELIAIVCLSPLYFARWIYRTIRGTR